MIHLKEWRLDNQWKRATKLRIDHQTLPSSNLSYPTHKNSGLKKKKIKSNQIKSNQLDHSFSFNFPEKSWKKKIKFWVENKRLHSKRSHHLPPLNWAFQNIWSKIFSFLGNQTEGLTKNKWEWTLTFLRMFKSSFWDWSLIFEQKFEN